MEKYKLHCLIINQLPALTLDLTKELTNKRKQNTVDTVEEKLHLIKARLVHQQVDIIFVAKTNNSPSIDAISNMLRQYSADTVLVNITMNNQPLKQTVSGIESCNISLSDRETSSLVISNLLSYVELKKDFRECKQLLSIVDKRNRWLVDSTREPIAYIYQGAHVHANPAYLSLFDFHSAAELMASTIFDLIPVNNHQMFKRFIDKQKKYLDTRQSLLLSMNTVNKRGFRAGIRVAPAVINNTRCLQIWIHELKLEIKPETVSRDKVADASPWKEIPEKKVINIVNKKKVEEAVLPVQSIKKKRANAAAQQAIRASKQAPVSIKQTLAPAIKQNVALAKPVAVQNKIQASNVKPKKARKVLTLKEYIGFAQRKQVSKLAMQRLGNNKSLRFFVDMRMSSKQLSQISLQLKEGYSMNLGMFRDYVLIASLISMLKRKEQNKEGCYLIKLNSGNLNNKQFNRWLTMQLQQISLGAPKIVFLLQHEYCKTDSRKLSGFLFALKNTVAEIGLDNFTPSTAGSALIRTLQVKYLSFDKKWLENLQRSKPQLKILSSLTQKLEHSGVEVIKLPDTVG